MALSLYIPSKIFRTKYDEIGGFICLNCLQTVFFKPTDHSIEEAGQNHVCCSRTILQGQLC